MITKVPALRIRCQVALLSKDKKRLASAVVNRRTHSPPSTLDDFSLTLPNRPAPRRGSFITNGEVRSPCIFVWNDEDDSRLMAAPNLERYLTSRDIQVSGGSQHSQVYRRRTSCRQGPSSKNDNRRRKGRPAWGVSSQSRLHQRGGSFRLSRSWASHRVTSTLSGRRCPKSAAQLQQLLTHFRRRSESQRLPGWSARRKPISQRRLDFRKLRSRARSRRGFGEGSLSDGCAST